ncbi:TetR family transcriptional regulator [Saccharothrix sp. ALI-22-I]|uniref:TetR/AcrR family transcriptional regulator n=1 Tax=Saccharothrix sp. ALI-22-I TaxID=1933778 RepID=UPI00097BF52F|nr:TetR/AcrR family transcriptional regulator [Saccharothrix sp. ALI-22-I]ONI91942.1 TetR family transcriptional regulator [Saccharothrix sp. ALI-22-I]
MTKDGDDNRASVPGGRGLRADAQRNRERVVEAAREVFAQHGLDASMNEIARRAGVGIATLLRRFPTRDDLIAATFAEKVRAYSEAIDEALADPDPWHGFCAFIERVCQMQADDRGFADVLTMTFPTAKALEAERDRAANALTELIEHAKTSGRLRRDFAHQDVALILMANAGVVTATRDAAPDAWRRLVGYLIQSFAAEAAQPLVDPPTRAQMYRALIRLPQTPR